MARDITALKQAEESLRQNEQRLRSVLESSPDTIYLFDTVAGKMIFLNREEFMGYSVDELTTSGLLLQFVDPQDLPRVLSNWDDITSKGVSNPIQYRFRSKSGDWVWIQQRTAVVSVRPDDQLPQQIIIILTDITAQKRAEEAKRQSEERFRLLIENASDVYYQVTIADDPLQGEVDFVSPQVLELTGYPPETYALNKGLWFTSIHGDDIQSLQSSTQKLIAQQVPVTREYRLWNIARGEYRWVSDRVTPRLDPSGALIGYQGVARDMTEQKLAENVLRENEMRYQLISNAASDYMFSTRVGSNGKLDLDWTGGAFEGITGYTMTEYIARGGWRAALHPDDLEQDDRDLQALRENKKVVTEIRTIRKDGSLVWVRVFANPVLDQETKELIGIYGAVQDITEHKKAEEATRQRLADLEAVNRVSSILRGAQTLDVLLPALLSEVLQIFQTDSAGIWLYDPHVEDLARMSSSGWFSRAESASTAEGIARQVFQSGALFIADQSARNIASNGVGKTLSVDFNAVCVPLKAENETIGVLFTSTDTTADEKVRLLMIISDIAGNSIRRVNLYEKTQQQIQRLSALHDIDRVISSTHELNQLLQQLLQYIGEQLKVDAVDILLMEDNRQTLALTAGVGFRTKQPLRWPLQAGDSHIWRAVRERQTVGVSNSLAAPAFQCVRTDLIPEEGFVAHVAAPLIVKSEVKGVLEAFHRSPLTLDKEWLEYFDTLAGQVAIAIENATLFEGLQQSNMDLLKAYDATILGWSQAMDLRDKETENHIQRVTELTLLIARRMGIAEEQMVHIRRGALLHDIGKLGVPDSILLKAGPLTGEERVIMRKHPQFAKEMLNPIEYLRPALEIPYCHHEKWDGSGYPRGLKAEEIPLAARIFALADVYDALTSDRPYRKAWSSEKALQYIRDQAGKHFDPTIAGMFLSIFTTGESNMEIIPPAF